MKILFISIDPPENRRRLLSHINAARTMNWDISLFSIFSEKNTGILNIEGVKDIRVHLVTKSGLIMFIQFNIALMVHVLFKRYDVIYCRGIWPLPGLLFINQKTKFIFDAHEYFPGLEIFKKSWLKRAIWLWFEKHMAPKASVLITVSEPILKRYTVLYPAIKTKLLFHNISQNEVGVKLPKSLILDFQLPVILFHGLFMPSRGLENLIKAMEFIDGGVLLLVGEGILNEKLLDTRKDSGLEDKVFFRPLIPNQLLIEFAKQATLGVSLLEPVSKNHKYALPNKFFEYIQAGLPVIVSEDTTLAEYVDNFNIGLTASPSSPEDIANKINRLLSDNSLLKKCKLECEKLAKTLTYEAEIKKLVSVFKEMS